MILKHFMSLYKRLWCGLVSECIASKFTQSSPYRYSIEIEKETEIPYQISIIVGACQQVHKIGQTIYENELFTIASINFVIHAVIKL